jgi:hypothetical protein
VTSGVRPEANAAMTKRDQNTGGGSNQHDRVGGAEVMQDALDKAGHGYASWGSGSAGSCWPFVMISLSRLSGSVARGIACANAS